MNWKKLKDWLPAIAFLEICSVIMALSAMGKRSANTPGEGNKIARLVLDDPTGWESFIFYFLLAHATIFLFLFIGWLSTKLKRDD